MACETVFVNRIALQMEMGRFYIPISIKDKMRKDAITEENVLVYTSDLNYGLDAEYITPFPIERQRQERQPSPRRFPNMNVCSAFIKLGEKYHADLESCQAFVQEHLQSEQLADLKRQIQESQNRSGSLISSLLQATSLTDTATDV